MKPLRQTAWQIGVGALALGAFVGCADNDSSLYVQGVMVGQAPDCSFRPEESATLLFEGTLDVGISDEYSAVLLIGNQLTPRGIKNQLRTETMHIALRGAEVSLSTTAGDELDAFTVAASGFASPNSSEQAGFGAVLVTLIPPGTAADLEGELSSTGRGATRRVLAAVRVFGDTLGGDEIESNEFLFPIDVCYGCLVSFPPDALDYQDSPPSCRLKLDEANAFEGCFLGQDRFIDCRSCAGDFAVCDSL